MCGYANESWCKVTLELDFLMWPAGTVVLPWLQWWSSGRSRGRIPHVSDGFVLSLSLCFSPSVAGSCRSVIKNLSVEMMCVQWVIYTPSSTFPAAKTLLWPVLSWPLLRLVSEMEKYNLSRDTRDSILEARNTLVMLPFHRGWRVHFQNQPHSH